MLPTRWKVTGRRNGVCMTVYINARSTESAAREAMHRSGYALDIIDGIEPDESRQDQTTAATTEES